MGFGNVFSPKDRQVVGVSHPTLPLSWEGEYLMSGAAAAKVGP